MGGSQTRPYAKHAARHRVRPDWIPAFAGMTAGLRKGLFEGEGIRPTLQTPPEELRKGLLPRAMTTDTGLA